MSMFMIDTSAWILALRKKFHPLVRDRIDAILSEGEVAINGIIQVELLGGARSERDYDRLKSRLDALLHIEATRELWSSASRLAFDLRRQGLNVPHTDAFIAASAADCGAVLLHADSHFDAIAKVHPLKVESFVRAVK